MSGQRWLMVLVGLLGAVLLGSAQAYQTANEDSYTLPAGETLNDDLYVTGERVIIDGTLNGDLLGLAREVHINGTVTGDVMVAAGSIEIDGTVGDDVRSASNGLAIRGSVGDDLIAAFGNAQATYTGNFDTGATTPGLKLADTAEVAGSVLLFGGTADLLGSVAGDVRAGVGALLLGGDVGGSVEAQVGELRVSDNARIAGDLSYTSEQQFSVPAGTVAGSVTRSTPPADAPRGDSEQNGFNPIANMIGLIFRLLGFAVLALLLLQFAPRSITGTVDTIRKQPFWAGLKGLLLALLFLFFPLGTLLLAATLGILAGWLAGVLVAMLVLALLGLIWILSPLITGVWLGQWLAQATGREADDRTVLIGGVLVLVLLISIPLLGWLIGLVSFVLALGGLGQMLWARRTPPTPPAAAAA